MTTVATTALLVALGCPDRLLDDAVRELARGLVPDDNRPSSIVRDARAAIAAVTPTLDRFGRSTTTTDVDPLAHVRPEGGPMTGGFRP